jgi:hypothetical protein
VLLRHILIFLPTLVPYLFNLPKLLNRIVNSKLKRMLKESLRPNLRYRLVHLLGGTEESHQNRQS